MEIQKNEPWYTKLKTWFKTNNIFKSKKQKEEEAKKLYKDIESSIIRWNIHGRRTAGNLTREILKIINKK